MDRFLSCDWGTSFFRLRLISYETLDVIAEEKTDEGIAKTFAAWNNRSVDSGERQAFYISVIINAVQAIGKHLGLELSGIPIIVSGMAASNIGMIELPYKQIPISIDGSGLEVKLFRNEKINNPLLIISGIKSTDDVIRGEETKIVGCSSYISDNNERLLVFTGTHPKHVIVKGKKVVGFKTYMTGEFFNLLTHHGVLASSVQSNKKFDEPSNQISFRQGVEGSLNGNLLSAAFKVRTNNILQNIPKESSFYYLSGLLIGTELRDLLNYKYPVYLCGGDDLIWYYRVAFDILEINVDLQIDADEALLNGQKLIYSHYLNSQV